MNASRTGTLNVLRLPRLRSRATAPFTAMLADIIDPQHHADCLVYVDCDAGSYILGGKAVEGMSPESDHGRPVTVTGRLVLFDYQPPDRERGRFTRAAVTDADRDAR